MELKNKQKIKLIIILVAEFIAISVVLLLIFFAGKKSYTVTFDLNGGILLSGDTEQRVTQGHNATPPNVAKEGHYLRGWSGNYYKVTGDSHVKAIWEYVTSPGIVYNDDALKNYTEIAGSHPEINGVIYVGAYYNEKIILTIGEDAFRDRKGIEEMHLLDGILTIEVGAFAGCENMKVIDVPSTVKRIGKDAFKDCKSLETLILPEGLVTIEAGAFAGCESLTTVIMPRSVKFVGEGAFDTEGLEILFYPEEPETDDTEENFGEETDTELPEDDITSEPLPDGEVKIPEGFEDGWCKDGVIIGFVKHEEEDGDSDGDEDGKKSSASDK